MNAPHQQLTCPKCRGAMTSYERSGIVVDQCTDCRGIFLDRGELERLIDLDAGAAQPGMQPPQVAAAAPPDRSWRAAEPQHREWNRSRHDSDDDSDDHRGSSRGSGHAKKKKHSLLKEFLDF